MAKMVIMFSPVCLNSDQLLPEFRALISLFTEHLFHFRRLATVYSFSAPLRCKSLYKVFGHFYNPGMFFSRPCGASLWNVIIKKIGPLPFLASPQPGTWPQPRHLPWPGTEPVPFRFVGCCPTPWAPPIRAVEGKLKLNDSPFKLSLLIFNSKFCFSCTKEGMLGVKELSLLAAEEFSKQLNYASSI